MNSVLIKALSIKETEDIMSCLHQHAKLHKENFPNMKIGNMTFQSIMVLFPDVANQLFKTNTKPNEYCIKTKLINNFRSPQILSKAQDLWQANLIPIEVTRMSGSIFYAIPKDTFLTGDLREIVMLYAEDEIPTIDDFYL
jgi:hypothetical protein